MSFRSWDGRKKILSVLRPGQAGDEISIVDSSDKGMFGWGFDGGMEIGG